MHVKSFIRKVINCKYRKVMCHCRKARPYRADLSKCLNVPVVAVRSKKTHYAAYIEHQLVNMKQFKAYPNITFICSSHSFCRINANWTLH